MIKIDKESLNDIKELLKKQKKQMISIMGYNSKDGVRYSPTLDLLIDNPNVREIDGVKVYVDAAIGEVDLTLKYKKSLFGKGKVFIE